MLITKFDLYQTEWLDMVFANRNKNYGAYYLRQHYAKTMLKAMGIAFFSVAVVLTPFMIFKKTVEPEPFNRRTERAIEVKLIENPKLEKPKEAAAPAKAKAPEPAPAPASQNVKTTFIPTKISDGPDVVEPPKIVDISGAVGPVDNPGTASGENVAPGGGTDPKGTGEGAGGSGTGDSDKPFDVVEHMPEPVGGASAWQKYLQKNLRYPGQAVDAGISGRVLMSFIIEADGTLSNIQVIRGLGYGLDDESLRVLKKAAAWKPGIQNGRPVRVRFMIPINFQLPSE